jgi:ubiquinone/menaquinone biosynthesis C-methylase UbiE
MKFNNTEFKQRNMKIWNEIAPRYHKKWAGVNAGPFQSTSKLVKLVNAHNDDMILDLACGTGVVTQKIREKIGNSGHIVGADASITAIKIAKRWNGLRANLDFINIDAEKFSFSQKFDIVTCQYALFFFPDAQKALKNIRDNLKKTGVLGISVHGYKDNVPFFSSILDAVLEYIPDYIPIGSPDLDRFGTKSALYNEIKKAGFTKISIKDFTFHYSPGKFDDYWKNYLKYIAKPLKEKLNSLGVAERRKLRQAVKQNTIPYTKKNGNIVFPWQVLILTAKY